MCESCLIKYTERTDSLQNVAICSDAVSQNRLYIPWSKQLLGLLNCSMFCIIIANTQKNDKSLQWGASKSNLGTHIQCRLLLSLIHAISKYFTSSECDRLAVRPPMTAHLSHPWKNYQGGLCLQLDHHHHYLRLCGAHDVTKCLLALLLLVHVV